MDLSPLFQPRSVVLIGASEKSLWSQLIFNNLKDHAATDVYLVNKRGADAHGQAAVTSCQQLPCTPDVGYVFVPTEAVLDAVNDAGSAGIRYLLLLTSGFSESGDEGKRLQAQLNETARSYGMRILGPNSLGFTNYHTAQAVSPVKFQAEVIAGSVAIVSQSGQIGSELTNHARQQAVGVSYCIATGNEMDLDAATVIEFLLQDTHTRAIAFFAEGIQNPERFLAAARRAHEAGKALVVLKVGSSPLATKLAEAHTGSVAGDDRVFNAVCEQYNVIRVESLEELICTAGLIAHTGPINGGVGFTSISGGACEIIADRADELGLPLPQLSAQTKAKIAACLPALDHGMNPLDITGAAVRAPELFESILSVLNEDSGIGLTACVYTSPRDDQDFFHLPALTHIGRGLTQSNGKGLLINSSIRPVTPFTRDVQQQAGIPYIIGGLELAVRALAHLQRWSEFGHLPNTANAATNTELKPMGEQQSLAFLADHGVPVLPQRLVTSAEQARQFAQEMQSACVLKIASKDIAHKSDIGGVRLNLSTPDITAKAYTDMMTSVVKAAPEARLDGALISPMREQGIELFIGIAKTSWGPALAVGVGGIWIELLQDTCLRLLPVSETDVQDMLQKLKAYRLLTGYRGAQPGDITAIASAIKQIADAALRLGPDLVSLEVNPLYVNGNLVEAMDALCIWE